MPRQLRIDIAGSFHHVMARGVDRQPVFRDREDRRRFLDLLRESLRFGWVNIESYCLMNNHFHILIESLTGDLSRFMQRVNGEYASWFNLKYDRVGHLFQDRFKSEVLLNNAAIFEVGRYIHMNPVRAGIVPDPCEYRWSSMYSLYSGAGNSLLGKRRLSRVFSGKKGKREFFNFTTAKSTVSEGRQGWPNQDSWYSEMDSGGEEIVRAELANTKEILCRVGDRFGVPVDRLLSSWRDRHTGLAKAVAAAILQNGSSSTSREIAQLLGYRSPSGVRQAIRRIRDISLRNPGLQHFIQTFHQ